MRAAQENKCKICRRDLKKTTPHLDHDYKTGAIRGLLCGNCNCGLGSFENECDDPINSLIHALVYLSLNGETDQENGKELARLLTEVTTGFTRHTMNGAEDKESMTWRQRSGKQ